jgi:energy-converting hydrogenase Eha subunit C
MAEAVGALYSTLIPSLSDSADIQEALRLYHYGAASGTAPGEYDPTNTNPVLLPVQSVAYYLNNLQGQITTLSGSLGVQTSAWTSKGVILTASAASTLFPLSVGSDGTVLTADSSATGGLSWTSLPVTLTNTATLSNKTLTAPRFADNGFIADANGNEMVIFDTVASAVNELTIGNAATGTNPFIAASGGGTNISINLIPKGTGQVQSNGIDILTQTNTVTGITNKSLVSPTVSGLYLSDSSIIFEGSSADVFETTLTVTNPTAARTITLPDVSGTVVTTGNLGAVLLTPVPLSGTIAAALSDAGKMIEMSSGFFEIPTDASVNFPVGTQITVLQTTSSQITIRPVTAGTTTVNGTPGLKLRTQWSSATLVKRAANLWVAIGDLSA